MLLMRAYLFVVSTLLFGAEIAAGYNRFYVHTTSRVEVENVFGERIPSLYVTAKMTEDVCGTAYVKGTLLKLFLKGTGN